MTTGLVQDCNLEKQIEKQFGCMTGFLQIFDRHQLLSGKRIYSTKRLPPAVYSSSESEPASPSPVMPNELGKQHQTRSVPSPDRSVKRSPTSEIRSPATKTPASNPTKLPLPLSVFEFKEGSRSSWKFSKEAPRLSLDSRAVVDAKGSLCPREMRTNASFQSPNRAEKCRDGGGDEDDKHRRSTSVIARLMGLESVAPPDPSPVKQSELRRSASESRVSKDTLHFENYRQNHECESRFATKSPSNGRYDLMNCSKPVDPKECRVRTQRPEPAKSQSRSLGQRKSFFDSHDVFPEPKQSDSIYGEVERRLRMRGIAEPTKDLETLKQILEALQLKGLLHSGNNSSNRLSNQRNYVHDGRFSGCYDSPIVLMRPGNTPAPASPNLRPRIGTDSPSSSFRSQPVNRRNLNQASVTESSRRNRNEIGRSPNSPTRNETGVKSPIRRRPLSVETQTQRKMNYLTEQRRASLSPVHSPKVNTRRTVSDQRATNRSPRNRKPTAQNYQEAFVPAEDECCSVSESSVSTPSQTDTVRSRDGRGLLERCDKLLLSIAEITTTELQPSPVSVLDSSFYKSSPSPVKKRSMDLKEQSIEFEDEEIWSPAISFLEDNSDSDFVYISEIFRASSYLPKDSDIFLVLEKQQGLIGKDTSKSSRIQRKLIFDTVSEILDQQRMLPPWKAVSGANPATAKPPLERTWSEFQRIRARDTCDEDLFEVICGVLRKDLAGDSIAEWGEFPVEMSEAVLDIERLIFRDLIGETIRDLASFAGNRNNLPAPRRKLVF